MFLTTLRSAEDIFDDSVVKQSYGSLLKGIAKIKNKSLSSGLFKLARGLRDSLEGKIDQALARARMEGGVLDAERAVDHILGDPERPIYEEYAITLDQREILFVMFSTAEAFMQYVDTEGLEGIPKERLYEMLEKEGIMCHEERPDEIVIFAGDACTIGPALKVLMINLTSMLDKKNLSTEPEDIAYLSYRLLESFLDVRRCF